MQNSLTNRILTMHKDFPDIIKQATGASDIELIEVIQELWSGYGTIRRYRLSGADRERVVVKHVHVAEQAAGLALEELRVLLRVEARQRDKRPEAVEDQDPEGKQDPALQVLGFCKAPEIHVPSHLFGSIRHGPLDLPEKAFAA